MLSVQQACSVTTPPDVVHVNHSLKDVNVIYVRSTILVSPTVNRAHATDTRTNVTSWPDNVRDVNIILMVSIVICVQKDSTETPAKVGFFKKYFWELSLKKPCEIHFTSQNTFLSNSWVSLYKTAFIFTTITSWFRLSQNSLSRCFYAFLDKSVSKHCTVTNHPIFFSFFRPTLRNSERL